VTRHSRMGVLDGARTFPASGASRLPVVGKGEMGHAAGALTAGLRKASQGSKEVSC
jgi:hypothetical protein